MRTIKESILGSNGVSTEQAIQDWWWRLDPEKKSYLKKSENDNLHYIYVGTNLVVDKNFKKEYPAWIVFTQKINTITIKDFDPDVLKRLSSASAVDLYLVNYNKPLLDTLPYCENMHIDNCYNLTSIKSYSSLNKLEITKCQKISSLKAVPSSLETIIDNCDGIVNLDGASDNCKGSITITKCNNLISLEGCPEKVKGDLIITDNKNLTNIESFPKFVTGIVLVRGNGRDFTEDEIKGKCRTRKVIVK